MDKYIIISFQKEYLVFSMTNSVPSPSDIVNSNKLYHNKLIYTFRYFNSNDKDIINLVNKVIIKNKINKVYLEDYRLNELVLKFIKLLKIEYFYSKNFKSLSVNECNLIINNKKITYVNVYYMPNEYLKKMLHLRKRVNINYRDSITDDFMIKENSIDTDALYFKKSLYFDSNYEYKEKDFNEFLKINQYLKTIHLSVSNKKILESIIYLLKKDSRKNVTILLYQDKSEFVEKNFKYLKEINKKYNKELEGMIRIVYSEKYVKNNLFKQLTYNNIKIIFIIIFYVLFVGLIFTEFYNYAAKLNVDRLNYELYLKSLKTEETIEESSVTKEVIDKYKFNKSFSSLLDINEDTVGWLTVNNTAVNYPVVQTTNNDYYLKRDFYKTRTNNGWIFMDYRNNPAELDSNTIIYGHNLNSGLMFGTLRNTIYGAWYKIKENQVIVFDTPFASMKWQIFSIYKTNYTTDYLVNNFRSEENFNEFVNLITSRSVYNFKQKLNYEDKILTLSTCIGISSRNQRLVIHAKLIK